MSFLLRTLPLVHDWVKQVVKPGDRVLDATVGNGHDTLFLAELVGTEGTVYGFDLQEEAVSRTSELLEQAGHQAVLTAGCHSRLSQVVKEPVTAAMFNLGYLPNGDKSVITQEQTTLLALESALELLAHKGIITIMCYPGHDGGASEASAVEAWARELETPHYLVMRMSPHNPKNPAPYLIAVQKNLP